jgi:orotate phosphoribosyltransferase
MLSHEESTQLFMESGALLRGHFLLTSGRHSDQYMQCAQALKNPAATEKLCQSLAEVFQDDRVELVVGPAMGGILVAYELARQLGVEGIFCERENGQMTLRRNFTVKPGQRVLVCEDVVTTGGSVQEVIAVVKAAGGEIVGVALLVDRSNGKVNFGVKQAAALTMDITSWEAGQCPLCQTGSQAIKPGSRS